MNAAGEYSYVLISLSLSLPPLSSCFLDVVVSWWIHCTVRGPRNVNENVPPCMDVGSSVNTPKLCLEAHVFEDFRLLVLS
jgi:hypothetical protein